MTNAERVAHLIVILASSFDIRASAFHSSSSFVVSK